MALWIKEDLRAGTGSANLDFNERIKKLRANGEKVHHLGFGQCPFPVPDEAIEELQKNAWRSTYAPMNGIIELRESIVNYHKKFDDVNHFDAEDVICAPGSKELIYLTLNALETTVIILTPAWPTYLPQARLANKKILLVERKAEDLWKLRADILEDTLKKNPVEPKSIMIFTNPDNPTGCVYTEKEMKEISDVCRKHDIIILSDEIYAQCSFNGYRNISITKFYPEGSILTSGIAKWCGGGGWRLGYMMVPKELRPLYLALMREAGQTYATVSEPIQWASVKLFEFGPRIQNYSAHFCRVLQEVSQFSYNELIKVGVTVHPATSGFYLFPNFELCREKLSQKGIKTGGEFCDYLFEHHRVAMMPGGPSFLRPTEEFTTRLCYVDFDGAAAIKASEKISLNTKLPENFVEEHVHRMYEGIKELCKFVLEHK